jgi:rhamnulokinase
MADAVTYLAYDLGAESGRAVAGTIDGGRLRIEEIHRFLNIPVVIQGTMYWDACGWFREMNVALRKFSERFGRLPAGLGCDTWGVDFGLLARDGTLLAPPVCYRDHRNDGMLEKTFAKVPREKIYARTGNQFMQFNTLYQLYGIQCRTPEILKAADCLLFTADLLAYFFCGRKAAEYTLASTSQMTDPRKRTWAKALMKELGLPTKFLPEIVESGAILGPVSRDLVDGDVPWIAVGHHDTASAVAAVPETDKDWACVSCGTWSIMGVELAAPIISDASFACNFTNEGGVAGMTRFMKNLAGLWPLQRCRAKWLEAQPGLDYATIAKAAAAAKPFQTFINVDYDGFTNPPDMIAAIKDYSLQTGQRPPQDVGSTARAVLEGLAFGYRRVLAMLETLTGRTFERINFVGGGTQNELLMQFAADALGRPVVAGPIEATAIGNILMQAIATGRLASLAEGRAMVRESFPLRTFQPQDAGAWSAAYEKFKQMPPCYPD